MHSKRTKGEISLIFLAIAWFTVYSTLLTKNADKIEEFSLSTNLITIFVTIGVPLILLVIALEGFKNDYYRFTYNTLLAYGKRKGILDQIVDHNLNKEPLEKDKYI